jgi:hypothetical protein
MLVTVTVLPDSRRAFWAAWSSTALRQLAAVADAVVVVEAAGAVVVVVAGAAVEDGALAVLSRLEELHPAASRAISTAMASRPMVVRRIASPPLSGAQHIRWVQDWKLRALAYEDPGCNAAVRSLIGVADSRRP